MDSLQTGFRFASKLLGMDQSANVANLVSQAFSNTPPKVDESNRDHLNNQRPEQDKHNYVDSTEKVDSFPVSSQTEPAITSAAPNLSGLFGGVLRVLGLDDSKMSALVINGLIFIAQMVKTGLGYFSSSMDPFKRFVQFMHIKLQDPPNNGVTIAKQ